MKLYIIAILVALIGLWASGQVQAAESCGARFDRILSAED